VTGHQPKLWFTPEQAEVVRGRVHSGEPTAAAIYELARRAADGEAGEALRQRPGPGGTVNYPSACAVAYLISGERAYANKAHDFLSAWVGPWREGELQRGLWALTTAVVHECCYDAWDEPQRLAATNLLVKLHDSFREIVPGKGDPHDVTNNHWAVAHAAAAMAAMAAHGHAADAEGRAFDMTEGIAWARGRTRAFLMHHGDQGLYHEGFGYMMYPASFWLPMVLASRALDGTDYVEAFPNLRNTAASAYSAVAARPLVSDARGDAADERGMMLSWNDAGQGWCHANPAVLSIHIAHAHQVGALRWMYDRLTGIEGDRTFAPGWCGWFFSLLFYPYDVPAVEAEGILPKHVTDCRQGLSIFRNRYRDGDDAILGCYAKATHVGGHEHDDAGSIRLMALGRDWIMGGGQARGRAEFQSIVTPADHTRAKKPLACGAVIWDEAREDGGVFGMDLRNPCVGYAERYVAVDFSGRCGSPLTVALLDQIDDHSGRDWHWNMTFEPGLTLRIDEDTQGFRLLAGDGSSLVARFLGARPRKIEPCTMPDSQRTYQSGGTRVYPGRPYLRAALAAAEHLGIYVVMAVQRGAAPRIELIEGLGVRVGGWEWRRPFGAAVPAAFRLGRSGVLSRYPSGDTGFQVGEGYRPAPG
jgi:hypothetical protein